MTEKKTRAKKAKSPETEEVSFEDVKDIVVPELVDQYDKTVKAMRSIEAPERGPDYHITDAGEILLDSGGPIPEDHPVHPVHRALAAARKASQ